MDTKKIWFEGCHALLAEDTDLMHELVRTLLAKVGISLDICMDGTEAVEAVKNRDYDLVLMDIQMPIMDGLEATRRIRAMGGRMAALPIIAMTANDTDLDRMEGLEAGINDYVGKPIDRNVLYVCLDKWLKDCKTEHSSADEGKAKEIPHELTALHGIDTQDGLHRVAGNLSVYEKMLHSFSRNYGNAIPQLRDYFRDSDYASAASIAHSIKGNSGNIGAQKLYKAAASLEQACKQADGSAVDDVLEEFEEELKLVLKSLHTLPEEVLESDKVNETEFDVKAWQTELELIIDLLDKDMAAAIDRLPELRRLSANKFQTELNSITQALDVFNTNEAMEALVQLKDINSNQA